MLLFSAAQEKVYGRVMDRRRSFLIGEPSAAIAAELDRLWSAEWQQKREFAILHLLAFRPLRRTLSIYNVLSETHL